MNKRCGGEAGDVVDKHLVLRLDVWGFIELVRMGLHGKKHLVNIQKAIEHGRLQLIYPLKMVIFHSYVSLPEGIPCVMTVYIPQKKKETLLMVLS